MKQLPQNSCLVVLTIEISLIYYRASIENWVSFLKVLDYSNCLIVLYKCYSKTDA
jgi:hypothetical protein